MSVTKVGMAKDELHRSLLEWLNAGGTVLDVVEAVESMIDNKIFVRFGNKAETAPSDAGIDTRMPRESLSICEHGYALGSCLPCYVRALKQENLTLHERVALMESREVCTRWHGNVDECGYCQRDALHSEMNRWADNCDCDCDACRDLANMLPKYSYSAAQNKGQP